jgi:hypothetical protein
MSTTSHLTVRRGLVCAAALFALCAPHHTHGLATAGDDGRDEQEPVSHRPTVEAAFDRESYRPGASARLVLFDRAPRLTIRLFRVADAHGSLTDRDVMRGTELGRALRLGAVAPGRVVRLHVAGPSGLYFAQLTAPGGRIGYAPFVLRPARLGEHRVAIVLPTQTWQAYNFRDDDGDGTADTWYAGPTKTTARLARPFENRGVPPHYRHYDEPFLRWLARTDRAVDVLSDAELNRAPGDELARAYDLIVFSGHHEYVTERELDAVTRYRDRGGNLMFLSANNFYWRVDIRGAVMTRIAKWRDLGRPEAALVGAQFYANDLGEHRGGWRIRPARAVRWLFRGTGLGVGASFSNGGIEADEVTSASPRGTEVVAEIPNLFGDGRSAQMAYYETPAGARVFAAGAFSLATAVWQPPVRQVMENLLARLSRP